MNCGATLMENLQTWICKKKGCEIWVCTHFYYGLTNVMFLPPLSPKCLFKESRWMTNAWSAVGCHSNVCVWKKSPLKLMSMLAKWPLCFFYISHCVSGVRWWSWFFLIFFFILWINNWKKKITLGVETVAVAFHILCFDWRHFTYILVTLCGAVVPG